MAVAMPARPEPSTSTSWIWVSTRMTGEFSSMRFTIFKFNPQHDTLAPGGVVIHDYSKLLRLYTHPRGELDGDINVLLHQLAEFIRLKYQRFKTQFIKTL